MVLPTLAASAIALWSADTASLHLLSFISSFPLLYFYFSDKSRHWNFVQIYSIAAFIFIPVSSSLGIIYDYFEAGQGLAIAQVSLTVASLAVLTTLNAVGRQAQAPIRISPTVDRVPVLAMFTSAVLLTLVVPFPPMGEPVLFASTVLSACAAAGSNGVLRGVRLSYLLLSLLQFLIYYGVYFSGFGRLLIATLGFAMVVGFMGLRSTTRARVACLLALIPVLMVASYIETSRSPRSEAVSLGFGSIAEGLGSVFTIGVTGEAIDRDLAAGRDIIISPERDTTRGATIVAALVNPVPRLLWPDKPRGIGRVGVEEIFPDLRASDEHSIAFMMLGEFYFEFGIVGMTVGGILLLFGMRAVERWRVIAVSRSEVWSRERMAYYTILLSGIPDLLWGGLFGIAVRALGRVLFMFLILWTARQLTSVRRPRLTVTARGAL